MRYLLTTVGIVAVSSSAFAQLESRDLKVEAEQRPNFHIKGNHACVHSIDYKGPIVKPNDSLRHHFVANYDAPCRAKVEFTWHSSSTEANSKPGSYDSYMEADLSE